MVIVPSGFGLNRTIDEAGLLAHGPDGPLNRPYSEQTQRAIDEEVTRLLRQAELRAVDLLRGHRASLDRLAALLIERETVDGATVLSVLAPTPVSVPESRVRT